jgi:hypothetical protein
VADSLIRKLLDLQKPAPQHEASSSFTTALFQVLIKIAFVFEPLTPFFATYFLNRQFHSWEKMNLLLNHKVRITRLERFCYRIDVHFVVKTQQVGNIIIEIARNIAATPLFKTTSGDNKVH